MKESSSWSTQEMSNSNKELFLWKVRRKESKMSEIWMQECNECLVLAPSEILAKGMALMEHPDLIDPPHVTKKDIIVTKVDISKPAVLS